MIVTMRLSLDAPVVEVLHELLGSTNSRMFRGRKPKSVMVAKVDSSVSGGAWNLALELVEGSFTTRIYDPSSRRGFREFDTRTAVNFSASLRRLKRYKIKPPK